MKTVLITFFSYLLSLSAVADTIADPGPYYFVCEYQWACNCSVDIAIDPVKKELTYLRVSDYNDLLACTTTQPFIGVPTSGGRVRFMGTIKDPYDTRDAWPHKVSVDVIASADLLAGGRMGNSATGLPGRLGNLQYAKDPKTGGPMGPSMAYSSPQECIRQEDLLRNLTSQQFLKYIGCGH